ncbi:MAG: metal-dependent hydrolase [Acidobacteriota bacterium]
MDTPTHGFAGAILGRSLAGRPDARAALWIGFIAAMIPDLDFLFLSGQLDYLRNHRGWSHSLVYLPVFSLGIAAVCRHVFRRSRLRELWLFAAAGIASHIFFDWMTSFGTMFFTPLSLERYSLDWVFIIDPFFSGISGGALILSITMRGKARRFAAGGTALLAVYILFCACVHAYALREWKRIDRPPDGTPTAVLPQLLSPFRWLGLSDHGGSLHASFFDVGPFARTVPVPRVPEDLGQALRLLPSFYPPPARARLRTFDKPADSPAFAAARALPDVRSYLAFARFPLATVRSLPDGSTTVTFEDLRFLPFFTGPWARSRQGGYTRVAFVYRVRLDPLGRPLERGFIVSGRGR